MAAVTGHQRQHLRSDGLTKRGWTSKTDAKAAARASLRTGHPPFAIYRCPICGLWHHGNSSPAKAARS